MVLWRPTRPFELTPKERYPFHYWRLDDKSRKSRNTWQKTGKFGLGVQNEAGQRLTEFCQENTLVIANTFFQNTREGSTYGHHQMVNTESDYILHRKYGEALYSQQKQDWEVTVAQIMNSLLPNSDKLNKVGKTTKPLSFDLNQSPYNYAVEVTNSFKGLDLIHKECLKNYGQRFITLYRRQWPKPSPRKRNAISKVIVWRGFTNSWEKKRSERQERKGKIYPADCRVPENSKER